MNHLMQTALCQVCDSRVRKSEGCVLLLFIRKGVIHCSHTLEERDEAQEPTIDQELYEAECNVRTSAE